MEIFALLIPLIFALLFLLTNKKGVLHGINATGAVLLLLASIYITNRVLAFGSLNFPELAGYFYIDSLSVLLLDIILILGALVCIYSIGYLNEEYRHKAIELRSIKLFYILIYAFIFTMILVVTTQNLGLMWIAIEATTLASVFLVGFYNNKHSIEAAWKYVIICSVGIALALLGIVFINYASANVFHNPSIQLNWLFLNENAANLDASILKIAFIFIFVGYGTKVGLAPMHTWLPDAHSQAPAPISALLSGVLLNSAMYGIIRVTIIVNKSLGSTDYTGRLFLAAGFLSIATAAIFILRQRDYKRLLAYSSIEHMGIIALGIGAFTPVAVFGALFHMVNHAFTKSMLFLSSGNVYLKYKTKEISRITGLLKILPITGTVFLLGLFAIAGMPPFSVFASELNIIIAFFDANHTILGILLILLISLVFVGIAASILMMFFGEVKNKNIVRGYINYPGTAIIIILFVIIAVMGLYMPKQLSVLIESASRIIMGGQ
ncbi:MAG TPA: hydrogenase 4 subunit F [Patescibacteria group bacterium]|nr:hydrogenase 4 subunit F [Patescibacteria group bacterium]